METVKQAGKALGHLKVDIVFPRACFSLKLSNQWLVLVALIFVFWKMTWKLL